MESDKILFILSSTLVTHIRLRIRLRMIISDTTDDAELW